MMSVEAVACVVHVEPVTVRAKVVGYRGVCSCGWTTEGLPRDKRATAQVEALEHQLGHAVRRAERSP